tara:strand:+ start:362 stop:682 length:321 start_codon:yes stop_codon:yes gene_type:complete
MVFKVLTVTLVPMPPSLDYMQEQVDLEQDMVMVVPAQMVLMQRALQLQTPLEVEMVEVEHLLVLLEDLDIHQHQELLYKALFTVTRMVVMERRAALMLQAAAVVQE